MAATVVGQAVSSGDSGFASGAVSGAASGDRAFIFGSSDNTKTVSVSGFTTIYEDSGFDGSSAIYAGYKDLTSSDVSATISGTNADYSFVMTVVTGHDPAVDPTSATYLATNGINTDSIPSLGSFATGDLSIILGHAQDDVSNNITSPSGYSAAYNATATTGSQHSITATAYRNDVSGTSSPAKWDGLLSGQYMGTAQLRIPQATASGPDELLAADLTSSAPTLGTPVIGQTHALSATGIADGSPTIGTPSLSLIFGLDASDITLGAPAISEPSIGQAHVLTADPVNSGTPTLGSPSISQIANLSANDIASGDPVIGTPSIGQIHDLTPTGISTTASVGAPSIEQIHALLAQDILAAPLVGEPSISGIANLTAIDIDGSAPLVGSPTIGQVHSLGGSNIAALPFMSAASIGQIHNLAVNDIETTPTLSIPTISTIQSSAPTPDFRTVGADYYNRTVAVGSETRTVIVDGETRLIVTIFEERTVVTASETRTVQSALLARIAA